MFAARLELIPGPVEIVEHSRYTRMLDGFFAVVGDQILLADVRDVARLGVFGEQMVERLILAWADRLGDRFIPFFAIGKYRIDVENDAAKFEMAVFDDFAQSEARFGNGWCDVLAALLRCNVHNLNLRGLRQ